MATEAHTLLQQPLVAGAPPPRVPAVAPAAASASPAARAAARSSLASCCSPRPFSELDIRSFANYELFDATTKAPVVVCSLWATTPVVIVFLRRLGCQLCRVRAAEIEALRPAIEQAGARVVCVTFEFIGEGSDSDRTWQRVNCWSGTLLTDGTQGLYRELFRRKALLDGSFYGLLDMSRTRVAESRALGLDAGANLRGDGLMLGGTVILDRGGELLLDQRSRFFGDDEPPSNILKVLRRAGGARAVPAHEKLLGVGQSADWSSGAKCVAVCT